MSSKLGIHGAYNRSKNTSKDRVNSPHESARINGFENEIKLLKEENSNLKEELLDMRQTVQQIFSENRHEKFDERRINMIKFQVIQLERQISLLTEALGSRSDAILEVENTMTWLADKLRSYLASEVQGPMISMSRRDLITLIESSESVRIKLFKCAETLNKEEVGKELLILNPFLAGKGKQEEATSLLDVCLGRLDYLNLRHVAQTESKLCNLYKELIRIHTQLEYIQGQGDHDLLLTAHIASSEMERTQNSLLKTCVIIKDVTDDLLAISLLCPSAPWPVLRKPVSKDVSVERVIESLPPLPSSKLVDVSQVITASLAACNHRLHLMGKEKAALKEEISFHQMVYDLQMQYTQAVFDATRTGFREFEDIVRSLLSKPVKNLLEAYEHLKNSASETALRNILLIFKENETQLSSIVEMLDTQDSGIENQGDKAISLFEKEFMKKVDDLLKSHKKQIEPFLKEKKEVREEQKRLEVELRCLIEELESKYEKQWVPGYKKQQMATEDQKKSLHITHNMKMMDSNLKQSELSSEISFNNACIIEDTHVDETKSSGLRSYLDEDYRKSGKEKRLTSKMKKLHKVAEKSADSESIPSRFAEGRLSQSSCQNDIVLNSRIDINKNDSEKTQTAVKLNSVTNRNLKSQWKPEKEWVEDFTVSRPVSQVSQDSLSRLSAIQQSHEEELLQSDKHLHGGVSLPHLKKKRINKREHLTYDPNLSVAQRSLNLKRKDSSSRDTTGRKE